jgi:hypothetical protein
MTKDLAMKTYKFRCRTTPILNLGMRWKLKRHWPLYPWGKKPWYTFDRRFGNPRVGLD